MMLLAATALAGSPVAVVELFTSEGCSSCPPADRVLGDVIREAENANRPVYALSFHVDYWDRLGWKDPFSDARWTGRQRAYATQFRTGGRVYTPQVVVNGSQQTVGSKSAEVRQLIETALQTPATTEMAGSAHRDGQGIRVEVTATGAPVGAQMLIAVAEDERTVAIERGENRGTEAVHHHVVRAMVTADAPGSTGRIRLPADFRWQGAKVVAWTVDPLSLAVTGATAMPIQP